MQGCAHIHVFNVALIAQRHAFTKTCVDLPSGHGRLMVRSSAQHESPSLASCRSLSSLHEAGALLVRGTCRICQHPVLGHGGEEFCNVVRVRKVTRRLPQPNPVESQLPSRATAAGRRLAATCSNAMTVGSELLANS
jgi:uncharacterized Zn finger protein (UPF0148 family)